MDPDVLARAKDALDRCRHLVITAGAGMGVDSGLPEFRGPEGLWAAYPPLAAHGLALAELARPAWFDRDPVQAWAFFAHRLDLYRRTPPHDGFARLRGVGRDTWVHTSNVDGQFQRAGFDPDRILEAHGSIHHLQCNRPCGRATWSADGLDLPLDLGALVVHALPVCPRCGGLARPGVNLFDDRRWIGVRTHLQARAYRRWLDPLDRAQLVVVEIGAGLAVPDLRAEGERLLDEGATLIRINPRDSLGPRGTLGLAAPARRALAALLPGPTPPPPPPRRTGPPGDPTDPP